MEGGAAVVADGGGRCGKGEKAFKGPGTGLLDRRAEVGRTRSGPIAEPGGSGRGARPKMRSYFARSGEKSGTKVRGLMG